MMSKMEKLELLKLIKNGECNLSYYLDNNEFKLSRDLEKGMSIIETDLFTVKYYGFIQYNQIEKFDEEIIKFNELNKQMNDCYLFELNDRNDYYNEAYILNDIMLAAKYSKYNIPLTEEEFNTTFKHFLKRANNGVINGLSDFDDAWIKYDNGKIKYNANIKKLNDWVLGEDRNLNIGDFILYTGNDKFRNSYEHLSRGKIYTLTVGEYLYLDGHNQQYQINPCNNDLFVKYRGV